MFLLLKQHTESPKRRMTRLILRPDIQVLHGPKFLKPGRGEIVVIPKDMDGPLQPLEVIAGTKVSFHCLCMK